MIIIRAKQAKTRSKYGAFKGTSISSLLFRKGLAKLGNIVAETLLRMQKFPSLAARETCVAETNFAARRTKNVFAWSQKHFCFPDTNFASETYVSQFSHPSGNITRNIVSATMFPSLARPFKAWLKKEKRDTCLLKETSVSSLFF